MLTHTVIFTLFIQGWLINARRTKLDFNIWRVVYNISWLQVIRQKICADAIPPPRIRGLPSFAESTRNRAFELSSVASRCVEYHWAGPKCEYKLRTSSVNAVQTRSIDRRSRICRARVRDRRNPDPVSHPARTPPILHPPFPRPWGPRAASANASWRTITSGSSGGSSQDN